MKKTPPNRNLRRREAFAALPTGKIDVRGISVGVALSSGNVDPPLLADILCRDAG